MKTNINSNVTAKGYGRAIIDSKIKTPKNVPFVIKKMNIAIAMLEGTVLPDELKKKVVIS